MHLRNHENFFKMKHKYFTLGGFCPGSFFLEGFCRGVYVRGIFVLEPRISDKIARRLRILAMSWEIIECFHRK